MSTYYEYQDVKKKIAHRLMKMDGWKVYGYKPDESDMMTDYYSPAYWDGIAEKNGYRLVVDHSGKAEDRTETRTRYNNGNLSMADVEKIKKLEAMTQERGASEQEEQTARAKIESIKSRVEEGREEYTVFYPGHMANPPRCNWHIEKDGIIYDKGSGLLKFSCVPDISGYGYSYEREEWQQFNTLTPEAWKKDYIADIMRKWNYTEENAIKAAESAYETAKNKYDLLEKFNALISRFNSVAGGMVGNETKSYTFEEITVTEYKKEIKPQETTAGELKEGQHIIIKSHGFNYGICAGYVYVIHERENSKGGKYYVVNRLNGKCTKELTGTANAANCLGYFSNDKDVNRLLKWIEKGAVAWCDLVEVKTPYQVKKVVKKMNTATTEPEPETHEAETTEAAPEESTKAEETTAEPETEQPEADTTEEAAPDMFATFAAAYINKKMVKATKQKQEPPKEEPKAEEPEPAADPEPEPEPVKPGFYENSNSTLTPEQLEDMKNGKQVFVESEYGRRTYKTMFFTTPYNDSILLVYKMSYYGDGIQPQKSADYAGFIANGNLYFDGLKERIIEKLETDINNKLLELVPDLKASAHIAANVEKYEREQIERYIEREWTEEARKHFYNDKIPVLFLYSGDSHTRNGYSAETIIKYISDPGKIVDQIALKYLCDHPCGIRCKWLEYSGTMKAYEDIKNDKTRIEHKIKKMHDSITEQKTVRVTLTSGAEIKIEASAIKGLFYRDYINGWDIAAADRDKVPCSSYGRAEDIPAENIKEIRHGGRILYKAS